MPLEAFCRVLLREHPFVRSGGKMIDDISVLVLERLPDSAQEAAG